MLSLIPKDLDILSVNSVYSFYVLMLRIDSSVNSAFQLVCWLLAHYFKHGSRKRLCCMTGILLRILCSSVKSTSACTQPVPVLSSAKIFPQGPTIMLCPQVSRLPSLWAPHCAAARITHWVSMALACSNTCQWASPRHFSKGRRDCNNLGTRKTHRPKQVGKT